MSDKQKLEQFFEGLINDFIARNNAAGVDFERKDDDQNSHLRLVEDKGSGQQDR